MEDKDNLTIADSFDTDEIASAIEEAAAHGEPAARQRGGGLWWLLLLIVIVFGYLSAARRAALGHFAEQVADIIHDFRGYDPEF